MDSGEQRPERLSCSELGVTMTLLGSRLGVWSHCQIDCVVPKQIFPGWRWMQFPLKVKEKTLPLPPTTIKCLIWGRDLFFFFFLHRRFLGTQHSLSKVWIREKKNISLNEASLGPKRKTVWIFFYLGAFVC